MLITLLRDIDFLRNPAQENPLIAKLGVKLSALRESLIGFVDGGLLKRVDEGIVRDMLEPEQIVQLFGLRLMLEQAAFRQIYQFPVSFRRGLAGFLAVLVNEQESLIASADLNPNNQLEWFKKSLNFHVEIVARSQLLEYARLLHGILYRLRVGSCMPMEDHARREQIVYGHFKLVKILKQDSPERAEEALVEHIREPLTRALKQHIVMRAETLSEDEIDRQVNAYWRDTVAVLAPSDSTFCGS